MEQRKVKFALWMKPDTKEEVEYFYRKDNCQSQSEFIEKAIRFYVGYLHTERASDFLPEVLGEVIDGNFAVIKKKAGHLMTKQAVENNITNHLIARATYVSPEELESLRHLSFKQVRETNGEISFEDAVRHQKKLV